MQVVLTFGDLERSLDPAFVKGKVLLELPYESIPCFPEFYIFYLVLGSPGEPRNEITLNHFCS